MNFDNDTVSGWFTLNAGFKVYGRCPACHSPRISFHKTRVPGLKGISASSQGLTPACVDCGTGLPTQRHHQRRTVFQQRKKFKEA